MLLMPVNTAPAAIDSCASAYSAHRDATNFRLEPASNCLQPCLQSPEQINPEKGFLQ